jgi:signal transduction histidine kinase
MGEKAGVLRLSLDIPQDKASKAGHAIIRVSDTGPGIPEDIQPRIFNPFYSTKPNGSGLGLAWTRKVVDAHDGFLDVHSTPREGAVFTIRLPLSAATAVPELNPAGETQHETQDSRRRG